MTRALIAAIAACASSAQQLGDHSFAPPFTFMDSGKQVALVLDCSHPPRGVGEVLPRVTYSHLYAAAYSWHAGRQRLEPGR